MGAGHLLGRALCAGRGDLLWEDLEVQFQFGEFRLDDQRLTLIGPAGSIHVEPQVFDVLHYLLVHRDRVVSKDELLDGVWGDRFVSASALTSRVKAARQALGDDGIRQRYIKTTHGRGYQFIADVRVAGASGRRAPAPPATRLIGREDDIKQVIELTHDARLVTVTGPGGMGKTTLALAVAQHLQAEFADGVVFVDLAPVPPGSDVVRAVADAGGLEGEVARSMESLADHLAGRPVLLILDNCEHVLERCAELAHRMLQHGASARILTTSREPLRVAAEHVWPLGPLTDGGPALFVERARAAEPRVPWNPADPDVIELCLRLDNLPLALELAAAQLRRFDLTELTQRLDSRLTMLSRRVVGDSRRHATMEATIDWSYQLLEPAEQRLLRQLSVFPASFGVAEVEASAPRLPDGAEPSDVLGELVDKSLVVRHPAASRYRLLETIRVFARDLLDRAGETAAALERHRQSVRRQVGASTRVDRWLSARLAARFRADLDGARQAFRLSLDGGQVEDAVEIATGAAFLWRNAIGCIEGNDWVDDLFAAELAPRDRLWAHILRADVGLGLGDYRQMAAAAAAAQQIVPVADDSIGACLAATYQALSGLTDQSQVDTSLSAALESARASDEPRLVTLVTAFLAVSDLAVGRHDAVRHLVPSLDRAASEDGYDRFIVHWVGWMLGLVEQDTGITDQWMRAQEQFLERTGIVETWLSSFSAAMARVLGGADLRGMLGRTLALAEQEGYHAEADCVLVLAYAEMCAERFESAAELMGTAVAGRFNTTAHYILYRVVLDRALRRHLPPSEMSAAIARGRLRSATEVLVSRRITGQV
jgi:predicted ATPase/DNA-binding winged helix-turn-helix (wHTH) protein